MLVTDNAMTFTSQEFQTWCKARDIIYLTGASYHPATNAVAECLIQTFKKSLRKSKLTPREALQDFLIQYQRTPLLSGYSPSELLNGRQIRTRLDVMMPSPAHVAQGIQVRRAMKSQSKGQKVISRFPHQCKVGGPCYALYHAPQRDKDPRWCLPSSPRFMVQGMCMSGSAQEDLFGADTSNS